MKTCKVHEVGTETFFLASITTKFFVSTKKNHSAMVTFFCLDELLILCSVGVLLT